MEFPWTFGKATLTVNSASIQSDDPPQAGSIDIRWLLGVPLRRWKLIVAVSLLTLLGAYGLLKLLPPVYQAGVEILMFDPRQRDLSAMSPNARSAWDFDTISVNTEIDVILSDSSLLRVVKDLKLYDNPEFQPQNRFAWLTHLSRTPLGAWFVSTVRAIFGSDVAGDAKQEEGASTSSTETLDDRAMAAAAILRQHITVQQATLAYVLDVTAKSRSPVTAQQLAQKVVDDYFAQQQKVRQASLDQLALWLSAKITALKAKSTVTQTAIEKLKAENGLSGNGKENPVDQQIAELNTQLMAARMNMADKEARLEQAKELSSDSTMYQAIPDTPESGLIGQLRLQRSALLQQQAQYREKFGENRAANASITDQLQRIDQAINEETARVRAEFEDQYDLAVRREQALEAQLKQLGDTRVNSASYVRLQELQRVADADGKIYDNYLARYNEIESSKANVDIGERIISDAKEPSGPSSPRSKLILLGGGGFGVMLGLMLAFAVEYLGRGMGIGTEAEQEFGHPVLGNIPLIDQPRRDKRAGSQLMVRAVVSTPLSLLSEAIRTIRLSPLMSDRVHNPKVIMVTSSVPGEGKSTIATLLAASSVTAGKRTLLMDGDVRGRGISRNFEEGRLGLTDLLAGDADLKDVTIRHPEASYAVILAGSTTKSLGDMLSSGRMEEIMEQLRREYDYIIVDTPPLLAVADALALATFADKILVAIDGRKTSRVTVTEAFRVLRPESHRIAGIVFNKVQAEQLRRYGRYADPHYYAQ